MLILGLMSGTSADGIDVALAETSGAPPNLRAKLLDHTAIRFPPAVRREILRVADQSPITAGELSQLNFRLGEVYAAAALAACSKFGVATKRVDLIGSHGQTVFHQGHPVKCLGSLTASTLQIGEPAIIAARTSITTVSDFRPADIAQGGQGAPLVPYADYLLYRHRKLGRVSLNLGGIANITVVPADAKPSQVLAFDTGPANMLIDALVSHFSGGRQSFDKDARWAKAGTYIPALLDDLMGDPYLKLAPPKSTGREYYGQTYFKRLLALIKKHQAQPHDAIRTATIFTAISVIDALKRFVLPKIPIHQLIVSGGGAENPFLMEVLAAALDIEGDCLVARKRKFQKSGRVELLSSSQFGIPTSAKEAFAFALMAYETFHHRTANLPSATGAKRPTILGRISYAPPR